MQTHTLENWKRASGDSNCAYNAAILSTLALLTHSSGDEKKGSAEAVNLKDNPGFKALLEKMKTANLIPGNSSTDDLIPFLRNYSLTDIQKMFQGFYRNFTIEVMQEEENLAELRNPEGQQFQLLLSEYEKFKNGERTEDEVFTDRRNPRQYLKFIKNKFAAIKDVAAQDSKNAGPENNSASQSNLEQKLNSKEDPNTINAWLVKNKENPEALALYRWWREEGITNLLNTFKEPGYWGGALELHFLFKKLGIKLNVVRGDHPMLNHTYGLLTIDKKQNDLAVRRLCDSDYLDSGNSQWLKKVTPAQITEVLGAIENFYEVKDYIETKSENPLKGRKVPDEWSETCKNQLVIRNIIAKRGKEYIFVASNVKTILERISDIDPTQKQAVLNALQNPVKDNQPVVTLRNNGNHWDNETLPAASFINSNKTDIHKNKKSTHSNTNNTPSSPKNNVEPKKELNNPKNKSTPKSKPDTTYINTYSETFIKQYRDQITAHLKNQPNTKISYEELLAAAKKNTTNGPTVDYLDSTGKEFKTDRDSQIALDERLALKLQKEEFQKYDASHSSNPLKKKR